MKQNVLIVWSALALALTAIACEKNSPTTPTPAASTSTSTSATQTAATTSTEIVVDAKSGASMTAPVASTPADNAQFKNSEQPIKLTVTNAVTTGSVAVLYTFEVATDAGFTNKVFSRTGVAAGSGQTSLTIDKIGAGKSYFWHARGSNGGLDGPFSKPRGFAIGPEVILQTPVLAAPGSNAIVGGQPTLTVNNVQRTGPAGAVVYRFDVADSSAFTNVIFTSTVPETTGNTTSITVNANLNNATYWWRVQASDPSNLVTTAYSAPNPFQVQLFSMSQATIWDNPPDLASWAQTATITSIVFTPDAMLVDFDKRDGPNRWPDVGFGSGALEYTLGMCLNISQHWNCSAPIQFWYGRDLAASGLPSQIGINWYYDNRWGVMKGYQPSQGELVGIFVAAGNLRDSGNVAVKERSNVVLMPFGSTYSPSSRGAKPLAAKR